MKNIKEDFKKFANSRGIPSTTLLDYEYKGVIPSIKNMTPYVYEESQMRGTLMDVFSRLMKDSTIFIGTDVNSDMSNIIIAQLLYLDKDREGDITMMISSPGGSVYHGNGIIDTMDYVASDISTINVNMAASMGAVILSNGTKGKRFCLPLARTMIHQVSAGASGRSSDMEIEMAEILSIKKDLYEILARNTGKSYDQIEMDCKYDNWMKADAAIKYGLIDEVVKSKKKK